MVPFRSRRHRRALVAALIVIAAAALAAGFRVGAWRHDTQTVLRAPGPPPSCRVARAKGDPHADVSAFPSPGTIAASPTTQISFRGVSARHLGHIVVTGSQSGIHAGQVRADSDGRGASFLPSRPFKPGEKITVRTALRVRDARGGDFSVCVADPVAVHLDVRSHTRDSPQDVMHFVSRPGLQPPKLTIMHRAHGTAPGYLFYTPKLGPGDNGLVVGDETGQPVYLRPLKAPEQASDLRVQRYRGKPVLTWWQGIESVNGTGQGEDVIANGAYQTVATIKGANGYHPDLHEFQISPHDTALFTAYQAVRADLSSVGGPHDGVVLDSIVQEVDIPTGLVLFEWHSLGHVPITDAGNTFDIQNLPDHPFDFFHVNSISVLPSGNLLVSSRNTSAYYDIDHRTGRIVWQAGGKHSTLKVGPRATTAWQHDVHWRPDGTITIFDNEDAPPRALKSRGIRVRVDTKTKTVRLLSQYQPSDPTLLASNQGSMEPLPNGDALVGWGNHPWMTEFSHGGKKTFEAKLPTYTQTYRVWKGRWVGHPTDPPAVVARRSGSGTDVHVSWNGATEVRRWQLLAGASPTALSPVVTAPRAGFETRLALPGAPAFVAARALDGSGHVLGTSAPRAVAGA